MNVSGESESKYEQPEQGIYNAACIGLYDIGTQHGEYQGKETIKRQLIIEFELLDEQIDINGEKKNKNFSGFYTQSIKDKSNLRKHLIGWRGRDFTPEEIKDFDLKNILGTNCILVIGKNQKGNAKIESISKWKGEVVKPERDLRYFNFEDFSGVFPENLPEWVKNNCMKSDEYKLYERSLNKAIPEDGSTNDEDTPF